MDGKETELDRSLLEAVKDPLTHLVRNAVDHGIEDAGAADRRRQGPGGHADPARLPRGWARHGRGGRRRRRHRRRAGPRRRRSSAASSTPSRLPTMEPRDIMMLVFQPGFSTADEGHQRLRPRRRHGRGQDQHRADRRHGRRRVDARRGHDLAADHPADTGDHPGADHRVRRRAVRGAAGRRARAGLHRRHSPRRSSTPPARRSTGCAASCSRWSGWTAPWACERRRRPGRLRRGAAGRRPPLRRWSWTACSTPKRSWSRRSPPVQGHRHVRRGDHPRRRQGGPDPGRVVAGPPLAPGRRRRRARARPAPRAGARPRPAPVDRLLVTGVGERRVAIPLDTVTRLEEFPRDRIEQAGSREVVQYRGPDPAAGAPVVPARARPREDTGETVSVVVYTEGERSVALVVDRIVDIVGELRHRPPATSTTTAWSASR